MVAVNQEMGREAGRWKPESLCSEKKGRLCLRRYLRVYGYELQKSNTHCVAWLGLESRLEVVTAQDKRARHAIYRQVSQHRRLPVGDNCPLFPSNPPLCPPPASPALVQGSGSITTPRCCRLSLCRLFSLSACCSKCCSNCSKRPGTRGQDSHLGPAILP